MSVCTGAFILAKTGLLAGKSATTHHGAYVDLSADLSAGSRPRRRDDTRRNPWGRGCPALDSQRFRRVSRKSADVLNGYRELTHEWVVNTRRGCGMFISTGARRALLRAERQRFLDDEWPRVLRTIRRIGLPLP